MIQLKPMTQLAYEHFCEISKKDYAQSKSKAERLSVHEGEKIAEDAWEKLLSDGLSTPLHHFYSAWENDQNIGMIWFKEERDWETPYAYLYQILIWDEYQGRGLGKSLMKHFEDEVKKLNLKRIRLHVFAFNERAIKMYEDFEFEKTNIVMIKELE
ncbi:MAG: GNAT family N-acetyltransferase [Bacteriovoracaceae bacterium]|nr:GNAT family N-acetyltransferase [Bacteriovoracaceae bacterium]